MVERADGGVDVNRRALESIYIYTERPYQGVGLGLGRTQLRHHPALEKRGARLSHRER
jgi:hypothetical protein